MGAVALRGLFSRKLRTILTMIAIILGVAMVAGTYVLTDTINSSFSQIFHQANQKIDAVLVGKQKVKTQSAYSQPPTLPASLLQIVRQTPGVAAAEGAVSDTVQLVDTHGKLLGPSQGAPTLLFSREPP